MTSSPEKAPENQHGWLEPLLWSIGLIAAIVAAAYVNETVREVTLQGMAYLFTFFSTPFVLEASVAFVGLCIVFIVNGRRIARDGDGWVMMEVEKPAVTSENSGEKQPDAG